MNVYFRRKKNKMITNDFLNKSSNVKERSTTKRCEKQFLLVIWETVETKNKQRKYGDQPHQEEEGRQRGKKGWNYNFGKNRSRRAGKKWSLLSRPAGRQVEVGDLWRGENLKNHRFSFKGQKVWGREGQSALFGLVITQTVKITKIWFWNSFSMLVISCKVDVLYW